MKRFIQLFTFFALFLGLIGINAQNVNKRVSNVSPNHLNKPTAILIASPANGDVRVDTTVAVTYSGQVADTIVYSVYQAGTLVDSAIATGGSFSPANLSSGLTYDVYLYDDAGAGYTLDATVSFTTILSKSAITAPLDGAANVAVASLAISWNGIPNATGYIFEYNFVNPASAADWIANSTLTPDYLLTNLIPQRTYYFRIKAVNGLNSGNYSDLVSIQTAPAALVVPGSIADGATGVGVTANLTWSGADVHHTWYRLQLSRDISFATVDVDSTGILSNSFVLPDIKFGNVYYWRVKYSILNEDSSAFSPAYHFTTIGAVPSLISPKLATDVSIDTVLRWHVAREASAYTLQVSTDAGFATLLVNLSGLSDTTYALTQLLNNTTYYWRVRSEYTSGVLSNYATTHFTTVPKILAYQGWPIGGATVYTRTPIFSWYHNEAVPTLIYDVLYSLNSDMSADTIIHNLAVRMITVPPLRAGHKYYWQVRTKYPNGVVSSYSAIDSFFVEGTPTGGPLTPQLSFPYSGDVIYTSTATLNWWLMGSSPNWTFEIEINNNNTFTGTPTVTGIASHSYTLPLVPGSTYYWKVRSNDGTHLSDWSALGTFTSHQAGTPTVPVTSWPTVGAIVYTNAPTLFWYLNDNSIGLSYDVQVSTTASMAAPTSFSALVTQQPLAGLTAGTTYYWRVRSSNLTGSSAYSAVDSFVVYNPAPVASTPPPVPVPSWPIGGASIYSNSQTLLWYLDTYASGLTYDVEVRIGALTGVPTDSLVATTSLSKSGLTSGATYNWAVRARNGATLGTWSSTQSFVVVSGSGVVATPVPSWPIGGTLIYSTSQALLWYMNGASTGLNYTVALATNPAFTGAVVVPNIASSSYSLTGLLPGVTYYWKVLSSDGLVQSAYSAPESFTIYSPDSVYVPLVGSPTLGTIVPSGSITASWILPGATNSHYEVSVSDNAAFTNAAKIENVTTGKALLNNLLSGKTYFWKVRVKKANGQYSDYSSVGSFKTEGATDVKEPVVVPKEFSVEQNYPNPFNPTTTIKVSLPVAGFTTLKIYNVLGEEIKTLISDELIAGVHNFVWNGTDDGGKKVSSGIYIYRCQNNNNIITHKMVLLK